MGPNDNDFLAQLLARDLEKPRQPKQLDFNVDPQMWMQPQVNPDPYLAIKPKDIQQPSFDQFERFQDPSSNPKLSMLMWLLQNMRRGMWGDKIQSPDQQLDQWLQQQMGLPQRRKLWM